MKSESEAFQGMFQHPQLAEYQKSTNFDYSVKADVDMDMKDAEHACAETLIMLSSAYSATR